MFSVDSPELPEAKIATKDTFEQAVLCYYFGFFAEAVRLFEEDVDYHSCDRAAQSYLQRCHRHK